MSPRRPGWNWVFRIITAAIALATLATAMQTAAGAAVRRGAGSAPGDPYAPSYHHHYRHGAVPTLAAAKRIHTWTAQHPAVRASTALSADNLAYGGGPAGVITGHPKVYLVFYGTQWGSSATNGNGDLTLSGDPSGEAPYLQELYKSIGTHNELWSGVMTQYCDGVAAGSRSCPAGSAFVGYPTGGALAGVWVDDHGSSPAAATAAQLASVAVTAATHFGNTTVSANRNAQYVIASPTGTDPDQWREQGFCAWHDDTGDVGVTPPSGYGTIAFTNLPYQTDAGAACGKDFVNAGSSGNLDGVSIVAGHEYAETLTDQAPPTGWLVPASNPATGGEENGDLCAWISSGPGASADLTVGSRSFAMQSTWGNDASNGSGGCEISHAIAAGDNTGNVVTVTSPGRMSATVGTAIASLPISASDTDASQPRAYAASGLPAGLSIDPATGVITGTPTTAGGYTPTVTVTDGTGASGAVSFPWSVTAGSVQLLVNPGFESGSIKPWTSTSGVLQNKRKYPPHSGRYLARLDGRKRRHTDRLAQAVNLTHHKWKNATFSFYLRVESNDPTRKAYDTLKVQVLSRKGKVLKTLATYSNRSTRNKYRRHSFSLKRYLGWRIRIRFTGRQRLRRHNTSFLIDDTSFKVS